MNEQDQRIAIAEACGWKHVAWNGGDCVPFGDNPNGNRSPRAYDHLPDYLNDLNAMHEAEGVFEWVPDDEYCQAAQYYDHLVLVCGNESDPPDVYEWHLIRATAKQRAEAFLKTLGKWKLERSQKRT